MDAASRQVSHKGHCDTVIDLAPFRSLLTGADAPPQGMTSAQLQESLGISTLKCRKMLQEAHDQGRLIRDSLYDHHHFSGRVMRYVVYRWKDETDEA